MKLKCMHTVRNLAEHGSNRRGNDESFRAMRGMEDWSWDSVNYEMSLNAAQQPRVATHTGLPPLSWPIVSGNCKNSIRMSYVFTNRLCNVSW